MAFTHHEKMEIPEYFLCFICVAYAYLSHPLLDPLKEKKKKEKYFWKRSPLVWFCRIGVEQFFQFNTFLTAYSIHMFGKTVVVISVICLWDCFLNN